MSDPLTLHDKLIDIQQRLKVPKGQENDFGGFKYRSIEDIEDKIKPLLKDHKLTLSFMDDMVEVGGRVYVKATVMLSDGKDSLTTHAFAREAVNPKAKTDDAQLTGACSSYARKYAASGLFLIDNTKDADSLMGSTELNRPTTQQKQNIINLSRQLGVTPTADDSTAYVEYLTVAIGVESVQTQEQAADLIRFMEEDILEREAKRVSQRDD